MIAIVIIMCIGLLMLVKPGSVLNIHHDLFEDDSTPSKTYTIAVRLVGCIVLLFGIIIALLK